MVVDFEFLAVVFWWIVIIISLVIFAGVIRWIIIELVKDIINIIRRNK